MVTMKKIYSQNYLKIAYAGRLNVLHSPKQLFSAFEELLQHNAFANIKKLRFLFAGGLENKKWLNSFPTLEKYTKFYSYFSHDKVLNYLNSADAVLLLATEMNKTEFIPAKLYEYFRLNKTIFAIVEKKGELTTLIERYGNSVICYASNLKSIKKGLLTLHDRWVRNQLKCKANEEFVKQFSRENTAKKLENILIRTVSKE